MFGTPNVALVAKKNRPRGDKNDRGRLATKGSRPLEKGRPKAGIRPGKRFIRFGLGRVKFGSLKFCSGSGSVRVKFGSGEFRIDRIRFGLSSGSGQLRMKQIWVGFGFGSVEVWVG